MNFLFPIFLFAGLAIAIPIIIHLFNFRKFKRVLFSDTRLLEEIKITSRKSAKIKNWWLLLSRILFLLALVLAFAQPYFSKTSSREKAMQIVYIDNSLSMQATNGGQQSQLQKAISAAKKIVENGNSEQEYILLSNNNMYATRPIYKPELLKLLEEITWSAKTVSLTQIVNAVNAVKTNNNSTFNDVYIFSDVQKSTFLKDQILKNDKDNSYYIYAFNTTPVTNIFIDTAYFVNPVLDSRQTNPLVVKLKRNGEKAAKETNLQLLLNNQVRAAKNIAFTSDSSVTDTLQVALNASGWQQIAIAVKDDNINFDDTFRITAKTNATLSILNISDAVGSPYMQAALSPTNGFMTQQRSTNNFNDKDWSGFNLIILQHINALNTPLTNALKTALDNGQSVLLIPENIQDISSFNRQLNTVGSINLAALDTARQQVGTVQTQHPLLSDVIVSMPSNAQLPTALKYYPITAGVSAGQQNILTFKNGKPLLAQFSVGNGKLFICSSPLNEQYGNFVVSPLFMPLLYKMSTQSGAQSVYAMTANSTAPVFIPLQTGSRAVFKISGPGVEGIPPQSPYGNGTHIFSGNVLNRSGFYKLFSETTSDSVLLSVNNDNKESLMESASEKEISNLLSPSKVYGKDYKTIANSPVTESGWPLWKWCLVLALLALGIETYFLVRKNKIEKSK